LIAILFILFVLVAATAFVVYRRQQNLLAGRRAQRELMSQRPPRSLFADTQQALDETAQRAPADAPAQSYMEQRSAFMARAAAGDLSVLDDAHATSDAALYRVVLNELVERAAKVDDKLHALVAYVEGREALRGSVELAEAYSAVWQESPDRARTATMLHLAALADDADTFRKAAVIAALFWQNGQLPEFTAAQLRELIDSQFWLISADARRTGAGFVLKQRLGSLRAELSEDGATMERSDEQRAASPDGI
jgi:hypothetical protein